MVLMTYLVVVRNLNVRRTARAILRVAISVNLGVVWLLVAQALRLHKFVRHRLVLKIHWLGRKVAVLELGND